MSGGGWWAMVGGGDGCGNLTTTLFQDQDQDQEMTTSAGNNLVFKSFFEKQKLIGPNFIDWYRKLRIVLSAEDKVNYLEHHIPVAPVAAPRHQVPPKALAAHAAWVNGSKEAVMLMLMTMDLDIQRNLEHLGAYDMLQELKTLFAQQAEQELLQTVREFHACKQKEGQSISSHVLKMKSHIDNLERLGHPVSLSLAVSLILVSLSNEYDSFVQNYNMHIMGKIVNELHAMLKLHEQTLPKKDVAHALYAIRDLPPMRIELYSFPSTSLVYDTGYGTHICITTQGLRGSRKLKPGALSLYAGDGHCATVEAIGEYHLCLPSGLVLILHNYHYAPSITRGIISVSRLYDDGFINCFDDNILLVSRNNLVYFFAIPKDGIYEIDLSSFNTNDSSMYAVSNKRAKLNLVSSLLWHCRLGNISKKHIKKLQHDGLLNSTDIKYFEKCVSCMSGKMARKPYQVERAKDLLGLICTDVCSLFRTVSRQGESYFVTFIYDFSRSGKPTPEDHKSLSSNHGGEYISQEFLDHLKEHGIIAHRTPPYTPQHNGMSKRRNRTLLDMVRSIMSQTTLPKSFWYYALESATRILNMVLTKKVQKTPYEVWHGKAPKLS
nr:zinc finger, CCHC-type [Tanacetum cinerariifolium]